MEKVSLSIAGSTSHRSRGVLPAYLLSLCSIFAAGCVSPPVSTLGKTPPVLYQQAEEAYLLGDVQGAREAFRRFTETAPGSPFRAWAYYWMGRIDLKGEEFTRAAWNFRRALDLRPEQVLRAQILMGLGDVEYNSYRYHQALEQYRRVEQEGLASSVPRDELYFKIGICLFRIGNQKESDRYFDKVEQFAGSPFLEEARRRRSGKGVLIPRSSYILVAGYTHFTRADDLARELRREGMDANLEYVDGGGAGRYEVRVPVKSPEKSASLPLIEVLEAKGFRPRFVP